MVFRDNTKGRKSRSVFRTVLYPLLFVVLVEAFLLQGALSESGVLGKLNQNERDILKKQVQTRATFFQNTMNTSWSDLSLLTGKINEMTNQLLEKGEISFEEMDQGSQECEILLKGISEELLSTMYAKRISGIFIILNTHDLNEKEEINKPGIYIRDFDPLSPPSPNYADLLFGKAPISLVQSMNISTDKRWEPLFKFTSGAPNNDFFYKPIQLSYYNNSNSFDSSYYGYWSISSILSPGGERTITYSVPLILQDGRVYGVLGIELLPDYLKTILPEDELFVKGGGSYTLAYNNPQDSSWYPVLTSGPLQKENNNALTLEQLEGGGYMVEINGKTYFSHLMSLPLYYEKTPFSTEKWALLGLVQMDELYSFSNQVAKGLKVSFVLTILVGVVGSIVVSRKLSKPITTLSKEISHARKNKEGIPELSVTNIHEIDRFAEAFTALSKDVVNSSARFLSILDMASIRIGGFEVHKNESTVFATKTFFELFGWENTDYSDITLQQFKEMMRSLEDCIVRQDESDGSRLYRLELLDSSERYIRIKVTKNEERMVGIAEDVTISTQERIRIEHERDYDLLTGLFNRRAFYRQVLELFQNPQQLKNAAILMIDLDNLKTINDNYGHDCGDKYIRVAGRCFLENMPKTAIWSRVSGDEFFLFIFGFEDKKGIRQIFNKLNEKINDTWFQLPDGEHQKIGVSGGIAWYPENAEDFQELMKLADFAMYQVKHGEKGAFHEFSQQEYSQQEQKIKMHMAGKPY